MSTTRKTLAKLMVKSQRSPLTKGQLVLMRKHGTPSEFAMACYDCVGEISMDEAASAIRKYNEEWSVA